MIKNYENNIIKPPKQFADAPVPAPRLKKTSAIPLVPRVKNIIPKPYPRTKKIAPIPAQRTQITEVARAFKGFTKSYEVGIENETDPLIQMSSTRLAIAHFM